MDTTLVLWSLLDISSICQSPSIGICKIVLFDFSFKLMCWKFFNTFFYWNISRSADWASSFLRGLVYGEYIPNHWKGGIPRTPGNINIPFEKVCLKVFNTSFLKKYSIWHMEGVGVSSIRWGMRGLSVADLLRSYTCQTIGNWRRQIGDSLLFSFEKIC